MKTIVLVTGGFDPIHSGHLAYITEAKKLGDILVVGLNSDDWLTRKKGQPFMPFEERLEVLRHIRGVDYIINFDDYDDTANQAIREVRKKFKKDKIIFANGGDRTNDNIPEMDVDVDNIEFVFGVGGEDKKNSSSWLLEEWKAPKTLRDWGYYRILHEVEGCKVKELTVDPGEKLSMQRHELRSEYWLVTEGKCDVLSMMNNGYRLPTQTLDKHNSYKIPAGDWHQLSNPYEEPCRIVEIQYGEECVEEDIERKDA